MDIDQELKDHARRQDMREQDYLTSGAFASKGEADDFHMFFSPYMVPEGLTDAEVRACVALFPRKRRLEALFLKRRQEKCREILESDYLSLEKARDAVAGFFGPEIASEASIEALAHIFGSLANLIEHPLAVPPQLIESPMTRESFSQGMAAYVARVDQLEKMFRQ